VRPFDRHADYFVLTQGFIYARHVEPDQTPDPDHWDSLGGDPIIDSAKANPVASGYVLFCTKYFASRCVSILHISAN